MNEWVHRKELRRRQEEVKVEKERDERMDV